MMIFGVCWFGFGWVVVFRGKQKGGSGEEAALAGVG
jgi:hypothetical protein